jgi:signal transduction histidine kinase
MALESSREELYEVKDMNIYTLCESIFQQAKKSFQPEVSGVLQVPRVNIRTNAKALEEILLYLLNNAAMHTESGKISLEFKKRSAHTGQFIVTDTGIGIPEEKRANLFKPFAGVQDLTEGDGLGLPTCSLIAYKLNGTLRLDEEYKKGARFVLELKS